MLAIVQIWDAQKQEVTRRVEAHVELHPRSLGYVRRKVERRRHVVEICVDASIVCRVFLCGDYRQGS